MDPPIASEPKGVSLVNTQNFSEIEIHERKSKKKLSLSFISLMSFFQILVDK